MNGPAEAAGLRPTERGRTGALLLGDLIVSVCLTLTPTLSLTQTLTLTLPLTLTNANNLNPNPNPNPNPSPSQPSGKASPQTCRRTDRRTASAAPQPAPNRPSLYRGPPPGRSTARLCGRWRTCSRRWRCGRWGRQSRCACYAAATRSEKRRSRFGSAARANLRSCG